MFWIFIILLFGGGDLCEMLIKNNQPGYAVALALVLSITGLVLYKLIPGGVTDCDCECDDCNDPLYVRLRIRNVERLLDGARGHEDANDPADRDDLIVDRADYDRLREEFDEATEEND